MAPTITKKITPVNVWPGRAGNPVEAVVIHVSEGGKAGVDSWFHNPASEASAHYLVNKDGTIWQFVEEGDTAWSNGVVKSPNLADPLIAGWVSKGINPNRRTIAIETERNWQERLTAPQLAALAWLCADLHRRYKLPTDGSRLLGHNEIDGVDRAHCPSLSAAEWSALVKAVGGAAPVPVPTPPVQPPADPGFPGALQPDGTTKLGAVDFGGQAVTVEEVTVQVRNAAGERYRRTWAGHKLGEWA